jgi:outer membrane protein assembly factor BamB
MGGMPTVDQSDKNSRTFTKEKLPDTFGVNLIVTNNLLFVAAKHNTYALDLASHQAVWSYHFAGKLALWPGGTLHSGGPP